MTPTSGARGSAGSTATSKGSSGRPADREPLRERLAENVARRARRASRRRRAQAPSATRSASTRRQRAAPRCSQTCVSETPASAPRRPTAWPSADPGSGRGACVQKHKLSRDHPPRLRVDVERPAADEAAERDPAVGGELDRERRGRADRDEQRATGDGGLLDELEREAAADAEDRVREGQQPVEEGAAEHLVECVVAPTSSRTQSRSPAAEKSPVAWRPPAPRMPPGRRAAGRGAGRRAWPRPAACSRSEAPRPRSPPERPCRRRRRRTRCRTPPQTVDVGAGRLDLDRVRGEIVGHARRERPQPLGEAEPDRQLLVVAWRPHRHGHGNAADPDLQRLLDRDEVARLTARHPCHPHAGGGVSGRSHVRKRTTQGFSRPGISIC